jgi:hypothetical protein
MIAMVTVGALPLLPPDAAAQVRQQQSGLVRKDRIPCAQLNNVRRKPALTGLPARLIDPKRTPDGWPDLQGSWSSSDYPGNAQHSIEVGWDPDGIAIQCMDPVNNVGKAANILIDPMRGMIPYQPWAQAKKMENLAAAYAPTTRMGLDTEALCFLDGVPRAATSHNFELLYSPGYVVFFGGNGRETRIIPMDGSPHLSDNIKLFMGDSRGRWEGNTLVVETTNNREGTWFDRHGTFHSEALRVVERWTMVDQDTMYYEATIDDPTVFTQVWKMAMTFDRSKRPANRPPEDSCHEGERSVDTTVRAGLRARAAGLHGYHVHVDLVSGKAVVPEEQKYLDESGQALGFSYAPRVPDEGELPQKPVK